MAQFVERKGGGVLIRISISVAPGVYVRRSMTYYPVESSPRKRQAELDRVANDFREKCIAESTAAGSSMTFSAAVSAWRESYAERNLSPHTLEKYLNVLSFWWSHLDSRRLNSITVAEIQSVIDTASRDHLPASVADIFKPICSIFAYAFRLDLIKDNPAERVRLPRISDQDGVKFWNDDQLKLFLSMLNSDLYVTWRGRPVRYDLPIFWICFFTLAVYSGARRSELVALVWGDIHWQDGLISIHAAATIYDHEQHIKSTKTSAGVRSVSLPGHVFDVLLDHQSDLVRRRYSVSLRAPVFPSEDGSAMRVTSPTKKFATLIRIINANLPPDSRLPAIPLHGLRHSAASLLISSGMDVLTVARRLGHSRVSHTLDIYSHAYDKKDETAAELLATVLDDTDNEEDSE